MNKKQLKLEIPESSAIAGNTVLPAVVESGAEFSECRKYRYALWRIWDKSKPLVMFIGLNPSTANENVDDPTIRSVCRMTKNNGYGGVYMMNLFAIVSADPEILQTDVDLQKGNNYWLMKIADKCKDVVFAWGNFKGINERVEEIKINFSAPFFSPKCIHKNKNGSPKHPLYCKSDSQFIQW